MTSADSIPIGAELAKQRCALLFRTASRFFSLPRVAVVAFSRAVDAAPPIAVDGNGGTSTRRHIPFIAL
jgi:hypothetical protein